jgi:ABC-type sugar transport system ATPase subunit
VAAGDEQREARRERAVLQGVDGDSWSLGIVMESPTTINFDTVSFSYVKGVEIISDLSLSIGQGLTLVLGANGCGKSTLLKLIAGIESPDRGVVSLHGKDLWKSEIAARAGLAYVSEDADLSPLATIRELIRLACRLRSEPLVVGEEAIEPIPVARLNPIPESDHHVARLHGVTLG